MPVHDWTKVDAGIFHHFHLEWMAVLARALNSGLLPPDHYALAEQIASPWERDVLTLRGPTSGELPDPGAPPGVALASAPPRVQFRAKAEADQYAAKAKSIVIRGDSLVGDRPVSAQ